MAIGPGSRLGPYEVAALIGEGGMGKVWRAHHTALNRDDALKVLPRCVRVGPGPLARFRPEAQVLASLNHPNIAHVYGLEQADGVQALVMELIEGETLADRIARGPIPVDEALLIAKQIAEALEPAHEQGESISWGCASAPQRRRTWINRRRSSEPRFPSETGKYLPAASGWRTSPTSLDVLRSTCARSQTSTVGGGRYRPVEGVCRSGRAMAKNSSTCRTRRRTAP